MKAIEEKLALRRAYWHRTKDAKRADRIAKRRAWYHRTKFSRAEILKEQSKTQYWRHKNKQLARNKAWRERNRSHLVKYNREKDLRDWGLTVEMYNKLLSAQSGVCAICKKPCPSRRRLSIDHCHKTGKLRGLLCCNCNRALGMFKDSIPILKTAQEYLARNNSVFKLSTIP